MKEDVFENMAKSANYRASFDYTKMKTRSDKKSLEKLGGKHFVDYYNFYYDQQEHEIIHNSIFK